MRKQNDKKVVKLKKTNDVADDDDMQKQGRKQKSTWYTQNSKNTHNDTCQETKNKRVVITDQFENLEDQK